VVDVGRNRLKRILVLAIVVAAAAQLSWSAAGGKPVASASASSAKPAASRAAAKKKRLAVANIFVSTAGRDTCTRSAKKVSLGRGAGHVCRSPLRACEIAQSGDTVIVEDGTYNGQLDACHGHESYRSNVVFAPEPGHQCRMTYPRVPAPFSRTSCRVNLTANSAQPGLSLGGHAGSSCGVSGHPLPRTLPAARRSSWINHLTIRGMNIGDMSAICAAYVELRNDLGNHFYIGEGAYHFYILGGDYGNRTDAEQPTIGDSLCGCNNWPPAQDVRMEGAVVHDFVTQGSGHGDGIFVDPSYNVQIIKNVLARNDCIPIYVNYATSQGQPVGVHGLMIIGNVVHTDTIHNGGDHCGQAITLGNNNQYDTIVAFNSLEGNIRRQSSLNGGSAVNSNIRIVGNVAGGINAVNDGNSYGCAEGTIALFNVLTDYRTSRCGSSSNVKAGTQFVSKDAQPNSPSGTNKYFTAPLGNYVLGRRAAAIKRVPTKWCKVNPGVCPKTDILGHRRPSPAHPYYNDAGAYENR